MRVLWLSPILFPPAAGFVGLEHTWGGGWLYSSLCALVEAGGDFVFGAACPYPGKEMKSFAAQGVNYFLYPSGGDALAYDKEQERHFRAIYEEFRPDVVHIHGTENVSALAFVNACPEARTVVSVQGLISEIARVYLAGLSEREIRRSLTFRDIVRRDSLRDQRRKFFLRGENEKKALGKVGYVIGRTSWDRKCVEAINPRVRYFKCNETLRPAFYSGRWTYEGCIPHTIFASQAGYPVKGFHILLRALAEVRKKYPDVKLVCAGGDPTDVSTFGKRLRLQGYAKILRDLIRKMDLGDNVVFCGVCDESGMKARYLEANLFASASSLENSSNSVCEAQMLGVPVIASRVGGVPDLMEGAGEWTYEFDDVDGLAEKIMQVFDAGKGAETLAASCSRAAKIRHDRAANASALLETYRQIAGE